MPRGVDTGDHPKRKVDQWSWRNGPDGLTGENMHPVRHGPQYLDVTPEGGRFTATLDQDYATTKAYGASEDPYEQYQAGPFRTQRRAVIAGESLGNRVQEGNGARYRIKGM